VGYSKRAWLKERAVLDEIITSGKPRHICPTVVVQRYSIMSRKPASQPDNLSFSLLRLTREPGR